MAIVFSKSLNENNLLFSYNNNTVTFKSNSSLVVSKATVNFSNRVFTLFPDPNGNFHFNFKYSISTLLNNNNFADTTCFDIARKEATTFKDRVIADGGTFEAFECLVNQIYDIGIDPIVGWTDEVLGNLNVVFTTFYTNNTTSTLTKNYKFLSAYVNAKNIPANYPYNWSTTQMMLKPIPYLKYWEGYPFDFTWYDGTQSELYFDINGNQFFYNNDEFINRIIISNGIELIDLNNGYNTINEIQVEKITDACSGHYIKWLNSYGGWNYWLFFKGNDTLTTKDLGQIYNDYYDVVDTVSPYVSIGKTSENNISVFQDNITPNEMLILNDLLESPKVYLFTGVQNQITNCHDWLEVNLKSGSFQVSNSREKLTSLKLIIEMPANTTKTL